MECKTLPLWYPFNNNNKTSWEFINKNKKKGRKGFFYEAKTSNWRFMTTFNKSHSLPYSLDSLPVFAYAMVLKALKRNFSCFKEIYTKDTTKKRNENIKKRKKGGILQLNIQYPTLLLLLLLLLSTFSWCFTGYWMSIIVAVSLLVCIVCVCMLVCYSFITLKTYRHTYQRLEKKGKKYTNKIMNF